MKKIFAIIVVLFFSVELKQVYAAGAKTVYSIVNGASWTNGAHWSLTSGGVPCGCTPDQSKDNIQIQTNTSSAVGLTFAASVTLCIGLNSTFTINGNSQFNNGSIVTVSSGSAMIINGNLDNQNNSNQIVFNGTLTVNGNYTGGTGSTITGTGSLTTSGTATTTGTGAVFGSLGDCSLGPCFGSNANPLPIELLSFEALPNRIIVELKWTTASEKNNDYFTIEKTNDAVNYETVKKVKGAGNSTSVLRYSTIDEHPSEGISYYRLKQTDYNGGFSYSNMVSVEFMPSSEFSFKVYPNPTDFSLFNLAMTAEKGGEVSIVVYDINSKESYSKIIVTEENCEQVYAIDPSQKLSPGVYLITAAYNQKIQSKKLIIKKLP